MWRGIGRVTGVVTEGSSEVDRPGAAEHTNDEVAQGRHDMRAAAAADLGGVLGIGDIADVVQRLDGPVAAQQIGEAGGAGLDVGEAGDRVNGHGLEPPWGV